MTIITGVITTLILYLALIILPISSERFCQSISKSTLLLESYLPFMWFITFLLALELFFLFNHGLTHM